MTSSGNMLMKLNKIEFSTIEKGLFYILLLAFIYPVLTNKYFLTGDGPCHVYNAKVLLDFITSHNTGFYQDYYELNRHADPNWFSHLILAFLLDFLPVYAAEKVFQIVYVIAYALSLRLLITGINPENRFLAVPGLLFAFHHTFQMGFYNYAFSFIFLFFAVRLWLKYSIAISIARIVILFSVNLVLYFVHPVGFVLSAFVTGLILLMDILTDSRGSEDRRIPSFQRVPKLAGTYLVTFLPTAILLITYLNAKGLNPTANPEPIDHLSNEIAHLTSLVTMTFKEPKWTTTFAVVLAATLLYAIILKAARRDFNRIDGLFLAATGMLIVYFNQPGSLAGAGVLGIRTQFIPYLFFLLWFANIRFGILTKYLLLFLSFTIGVLLLSSRVPHHKMASEAVSEYLTVIDHIEEKSTVLPLSFAHNGIALNGELIADHIWLFLHAADYLGAYKSLIMMGNYEANTNWFPLTWKHDVNPFLHLSTNGGIEHEPPGVDILGYSAKTDVRVDYVVTWCLDNQFIDHPYTRKTLGQLDRAYDLVFVSENNRANLYRLKNSNEPDGNGSNFEGKQVD